MENLEQMKQPNLVEPSIKYKNSFFEALREGVGPSFYKELDIDDTEKHFARYIDRLSKVSQGIGLKDGYVPATTLWLVEADKFIGRAQIRHELNEKLLKEGGHIGYGIRISERGKGYGNKILELALEKAKSLGLSKVLLTCDDDNSASVKIIENNGGVLENKTEQDGVVKRRYWIEIK